MDPQYTDTEAGGLRLLTLRTLSRLTQVELARRVGVSKYSILKWEGGESSPNEAHLRKLISGVCGVGGLRRRPGARGGPGALGEHSPAGQHAAARLRRAWFAEIRSRGQRSSTSNTFHEPDRPSPTPEPCCDWGEAIDVPALYGREAELATLQQWVLTERCRTVALLGLGGMGKTSLALTFARQALPHFEVVLFRSLRNAPPAAELCDQLIRATSVQQTTLPDSTSTTRSPC